MFAVQYILTSSLGTGADWDDLPWTTWTGHDSYAAEAEAWDAAAEFDAAFDGKYTHRVVANDTEES